jgi:hypothetical protein
MKKALLGLLIWLVIPGGVAAVAFFFIGPNLGRIPEARKGAQAVTDLVAASTGMSPAATEDKGGEKVEKPEPKSKIEVDPDPVKRSRNKHRRAEVTVVKEGVVKDEAPPVEEPTPDEPPADDPPIDDNNPENDPASNPGQGDTTGA